MKGLERMWVVYLCIGANCISHLRVWFPDGGPGSQAIQCPKCGTFNNCLMPGRAPEVLEVEIEEKGPRRPFQKCKDGFIRGMRAKAGAEAK